MRGGGGVFYLEPPGRVDHIQSSQIPFIPAYMYMDQGTRFKLNCVDTDQKIKIPSGLDNSFIHHHTHWLMVTQHPRLLLRKLCMFNHPPWFAYKE